MAPSNLSINLTLIFLLCLCRCVPSSSSQTTFTLSLTQHTAPETNQHPLMRTLVSSSRARAHRLKKPNDNAISEIPLFPHQSYHSVSLSFGTPSQILSFLMDTGSSLVWFPCTHRYTCSHCNFPGVSPTVFIPKLSSSANFLGCKYNKCGWVNRTTDTIQCNDAKQNCIYKQNYGTASTTGSLLSETLHFPEGDVTDFTVGCSEFTVGSPVGLVGFGRGVESLPAQMGLKKFSYCLVSHRFDDAPVSSELVLVRDYSNSGAGDGGISYTNFSKNPTNFKEYYYLNLEKITIGGKPVNIPYVFLVPGFDGNGGTIIDSGTMFTVMDSPIYDLIAQELENQISEYKYKRALEVESNSTFSSCFEFGAKPPEFPELVFHFEGGAELSLWMDDYFWSPKSGVSCMTILSSNSNVISGPSIIIGNYQQQNIYFEYDLENGRLGFKKKICK